MHRFTQYITEELTEQYMPTERQPVQCLTETDAGYMAYLQFHRPPGLHVLQDIVTFCSTGVKS
jgi:hypothetical protein